MDKARIRDLEGLYSAALYKIDELEAQCATAEDEIYELIQDRMKIQAQAAAMREALEAAIVKSSWEFQHVAKADVMEILDTPDAGRELLERLAKTEATTERKTALVAALEDENANLRNVVYSQGHELAKAEAERVEAYVPKSFCRDQCAYWKPELEGCGEWKKEHCEVRYFHDYLRSNHMIREAE